MGSPRGTPEILDILKGNLRMRGKIKVNESSDAPLKNCRVWGNHGNLVEPKKTGVGNGGEYGK